jgi:UDP-N-acetyl-D-galactosamine dehydrogenase
LSLGQDGADESDINCINMLSLADLNIAVIGLGYVGLPLAVEFGKKRPVVGYDISLIRCHQLNSGFDITLEISEQELKAAEYLLITSNPELLRRCNCFIITVPTPIDEFKRPDLSFLLDATRIVGDVLKPGFLVIYESTVYPGATEEECVPILEKHSGLHYGKPGALDQGRDCFYVGYSPERINPGDKEHRLSSIKKITSGSTPEAAVLIDELYREIITAGTYPAESIIIAEAAKVIENTQRDINIALVNELAILFNRMSIDTDAVLRAASSKWNFLPFKPGLVGGHCIGVDPYYLTHKAQAIGYHPEIILAGRRLNDSMGRYVVSTFINEMIKQHIPVFDSTVLIMGVTFKENCPDTRNSKILDVISLLSSYGCRVEVYDPWISVDFDLDLSGGTLIEHLKDDRYDGIIVAVPHEEFRAMDANSVRQFGRTKHVFYDLKSVYPQHSSDLRL